MLTSREAVNDSKLGVLALKQRQDFVHDLIGQVGVKHLAIVFGTLSEGWPHDFLLLGAHFFFSSFTSPANRFNLSGTNRSAKPAMNAQRSSFAKSTVVFGS